MLRRSLAIAAVGCLLGSSVQAQVGHRPAAPTQHGPTAMHPGVNAAQGSTNAFLPGALGGLAVSQFNNPYFNNVGGAVTGGFNNPYIGGPFAVSGGFNNPLGGWGGGGYGTGWGSTGFNGVGFNNPMLQGNMLGFGGFNGGVMPNNNLDALGQGLVGTTKNDPFVSSQMNGTNGTHKRSAKASHKATSRKKSSTRR